MQAIPKVDFVQDEDKEYTDHILYVRPNDNECRRVVDAMNHKGLHATVMTQDISVSPPPAWLRGVPTLYSRYSRVKTEGVHLILQSFALMHKQQVTMQGRTNMNTIGQCTTGSSGLFEDGMWIEVDDAEQQAWRRKKSLDARPGDTPGRQVEYVEAYENQYQKPLEVGGQNNGAKAMTAEQVMAQRANADKKFSNRNNSYGQGSGSAMPQERHDMRTDTDSNNALERYKAQRTSMDQRVMNRNNQVHHPGHMR